MKKAEKAAKFLVVLRVLEEHRVIVSDNTAKFRAVPAWATEIVQAVRKCRACRSAGESSSHLEQAFCEASRKVL